MLIFRLNQIKEALRILDITEGLSVDIRCPKYLKKSGNSTLIVFVYQNISQIALNTANRIQFYLFVQF